MTIIIAGTVRVPPEKLSSLKPHQLAMLEASRVEDGCVTYSYGVDVAEPGLIRVFEVWRDQAAIDAHFAAPHFAAWREANPGLEVSDRHIVIYDATHLKTL